MAGWATFVAWDEARMRANGARLGGLADRADRAVRQLAGSDESMPAVRALLVMRAEGVEPGASVPAGYLGVDPYTHKRAFDAPGLDRRDGRLLRDAAEEMVRLRRLPGGKRWAPLHDRANHDRALRRFRTSQYRLRLATRPYSLAVLGAVHAHRVHSRRLYHVFADTVESFLNNLIFEVPEWPEDQASVVPLLQWLGYSVDLPELAGVRIVSLLFTVKSPQQQHGLVGAGDEPPADSAGDGGDVDHAVADGDLLPAHHPNHVGR